MTRQINLIVILFYVLGSVGIPVAAYSCSDSGEAGLVAYLPASPKSCYADSCCEDEQVPSSVRIERDPCCDLSVQVAPEGDGIVLPGQKYGHVVPLTGPALCFDTSRNDVRAASVPPRCPIFHSAVNLPLLI